MMKYVLISFVIAYLFHMLVIYYSIPFYNAYESDFDIIDTDEDENDKYFEDIFEKTCRIYDSDALSAIRRSKTQECKYKMAKIACQIQDGNFYPEYLPNSCPYNNNESYGKYLGCYADQFDSRTLPNIHDVSESNSIERCLDLCLQGGFPYAGVEYGVECFCGNEEPPSSSKLPESACDMKCSGAPGETCGGSLTINIFQTGLTKFIPATPNEPSTSTGGKANIVFLLTLSGRALRQIHRIINALYRSNHYFYIHVDARHDYLHRNLLLLEERFPNVKLSKKRFTTIWAGVSFWLAMLSSMEDLIDFNWNWDFVINLSESDFPIKPIEELESFLSANKNYNFVHSHKINFKEYINKQGLDKTFVECEERMWLIGERDLPKGIIVDGASDWMALSREFVSYLVGEKDELLTGLNFLFKHTLMPPESYFHMVLKNSRFCNTFVDNDLHFTNWQGDPGCQCTKEVIDWCGCSPLDFRAYDWNTIQNTRDIPKYFSRKYEAVIDQKIINKVEKFIGYEDHDLIDTLNVYWENIYSHEDKKYPKNHDLLRSHAESISRINARHFKNEKCDILPNSIIDINLYRYSDIYWGNLILHHAVLENKDVIIETWYRPKPRELEKNPKSEFVERVKIFEVSSNYDKKEKIFRNFGSVLGPYSALELLYEFTLNGNNEEIFIIKWVDPHGIVADISNIHVNKKTLRDFIKPNLKTPITSGIWKAQLFKNKNFILAATFLIIPLELEEEIHETQISKPLTSESLEKNDDGNLIVSKNITNVGVFSNDKRKNALVFTDKLTLQFYNIIETCVSHASQIKEPIKCGDKVLNICESSRWSSLYPDPKGFVGTLNKTTDRLDRINV